MKQLPANHHRLVTYLLAVVLSSSPAVAAAAAGNASAWDIRQETVELLQALKTYGAEQKDKALAQARTALENLDNRIDTLESGMFEQWAEMDQAARDEAQASLQALRQQRTRVAEWYGSMKSSSTSAWGQVKAGFSSAYRSLQGAWENSESKFGPEDKK